MPKYQIKTDQGTFEIETADEQPIQGAHPEARMSAAVPGGAEPASPRQDQILGQPLMPGGPKAVSMAGGALRTAAPTLGKIAQFAGENFPTLTNPGKPIAAMLRTGGKYLAGSGSANAATQAAPAAAESSPLVRLATEHLPNVHELEIAARASGASAQRAAAIAREQLLNLLTSKAVR